MALVRDGMSGFARLVTLVGCSTVFALAAAGVPERASAQAEALVPSVGRPLPLAGFHSLIVDPIHDYVLVSGGPGTGDILVLDYLGNVVKEINAPGASAMVLSGRRVYVASRDHSTIDVIDTDKLERVRRYDLGRLSQPEFVGLTRGLLWLTHGECSSDGGMASLDLATGRVKVYDRYPVDPDYCPELATSAVDPGLLWVWERGLSPQSLLEYDVSSGRARPVKDHWDVDFGLSDIDFSPDGLTFLSPAYGGAAGERRVFNLSSYASYNTREAGVFATEYSPSGSHVAVGGYEHAAGTRDVFLFRHRDPQPALTFDLKSPTANTLALPRGVTFSSDASSIFAVSVRNHYDENAEVYFHVLPTNVKESRLRVRTSRPRVRFGEATRITAELGAHEESSNREVSILAVSRAGRREVIKRGEVHGKGKTSVTDRPRSETYYVAQWSGDDSYASARAGVVVDVRARVRGIFRRAYGRAGRYLLFHDQTNPLYVAWVRPTHEGDRVFIAFQQRRRGRWAGSTQGFKMGREGVAGVLFPGRYMRKGVPFRTRAFFKDDRDHLGDTSRWIYWKITR